MSLREYRAKRDFTRSPEPSGDEPRRPRARGRFFCVQKHLASHLHYDFRLEHDGVLLSWAVPKGPSLDPSVKRLAMHVEDHPLDYGEFEGVIPSGYGAGIVMLWDRGTWIPESADVAAALKKGDLKFRLEGTKLKGSWVLVRTRGAEGRSWLLIKHRDEWAGPVDITEFAPLSVRSRGDFADILASDQPDVWASHKPAGGGAAGALLSRVIEEAAALKASRQHGASDSDEKAAGSSARAAARKSRGRRKPVSKLSAGTARATTSRRTPRAAPTSGTSGQRKRASRKAAKRR